MLCIGLFLIELGYWVPPFMIAPYAHQALHASSDFAFYLLAIMNAGGFVGRILPAYAAQVKTLGPAPMLAGGALALSITVFAWVGIHDIGGLIAWGVLVGFTSGIPVSFPNSVVPQFTSFASVVGARTGMMWTFVSFATLIGASLVGLLIDTSKNDYMRG